MRLSLIACFALLSSPAFASSLPNFECFNTNYQRTKFRFTRDAQGFAEFVAQSEPFIFNRSSENGFPSMLIESDDAYFDGRYAPRFTLRGKIIEDHGSGDLQSGLVVIDQPRIVLEAVAPQFPDLPVVRIRETDAWNAVISIETKMTQNFEVLTANFSTKRFNGRVPIVTGWASVYAYPNGTHPTDRSSHCRVID